MCFLLSALTAVCFFLAAAKTIWILWWWIMSHYFSTSVMVLICQPCVFFINVNLPFNFPRMSSLHPFYNDIHHDMWKKFRAGLVMCCPAFLNINWNGNCSHLIRSWNHEKVPSGQRCYQICALWCKHNVSWIDITWWSLGWWSRWGNTCGKLLGLNF